MKPNMGTADRVIRTLIVIAVAVLYYTHVISGTLALILAVLALIFLLTSLVSWCPIWQLFGISTAPKGAAPAASAPPMS